MTKTSGARQAFCCSVALLAAFMCSSLAHATPVTLRFEATIHTVFEGFPFDSGIDFAVGDVITGQFTFDPSAGNPIEISYSAVQPYDFLLDINGTKLFSSGYTLFARNNSPISDFPPATLVDILEAEGLFSTSAGSNIDPSRSGVRFDLFGESEILDDPRFPTGDEEWNEFLFFRELSVFFGDRNGGAVGFQATIGKFSSVPEPSNHVCYLAVLILLIVSMSRFR